MAPIRSPINAFFASWIQNSFDYLILQLTNLFHSHVSVAYYHSIILMESVLRVPIKIQR